MKEMTCNDFEEVVHGFVHMELLDVTVREIALEHAAHCAECSERMADATVLAEASQAMGENVRGEQAPPSIEAALVAAFRSHHRRVSWQRALEWASVGAAAAVLLLFLWLGNGKQKAKSTPATRKAISSESVLPAQAEATAPLKVDSKTVAATASSAADASSTNEPYVASDFVPVPYTGAIVADDPGMVVRVQLTRASLAQLGYPVAETPDEDLILADVLVGEDGWPRGVKL
ncbi:MAG TPA: hypothetical protein VHS29_07975, partial [Candidatus Acidoferrales bacterium]|nr:hypothetical protein [Candidatus Acidoferrales bacterium]